MPLPDTSSNTKLLILTTIISALSFILAFSWNNFIQATIDRYVKEGNTVKAQFIYAMVVTVIVIICIHIVNTVYGFNIYDKITKLF